MGTTVKIGAADATSGYTNAPIIVPSFDTVLMPPTMLSRIGVSAPSFDEMRTNLAVALDPVLDAKHHVASAPHSTCR